MDTLERKQLFYRGRVQGVGFRITALRTAARYAVNGFVRNLSDGRVELQCEGEAGEIAKFVVSLAEQMQDNIQEVECHNQQLTGEAEGFSIL